MDKYSVFGELLYIGFVCEKGRCRSSGLWKYGYKNILTKHINMLKKYRYVCPTKGLQMKRHTY